MLKGFPARAGIDLSRLARWLDLPLDEWGDWIDEENNIELRLKDHSFDCGAGRAHGFDSPDFESVYDANDPQSIEDAYIDLIEQVEEYIEDKFKKKMEVAQ